MMRKYDGEDEFMRDKPTLNVKNISRFDGKYLWEVALDNLAITNVTKAENETYGPKYEIIFSKFKSEFIKSCESAFLTIQYVKLPDTPVYEDLSQTYSNARNVEISLAITETRLTYVHKLFTELTAYQDRVRLQTSNCFENLKI